MLPWVRGGGRVAGRGGAATWQGGKAAGRGGAKKADGGNGQGPLRPSIVMMVLKKMDTSNSTDMFFT